MDRSMSINDDLMHIVKPHSNLNGRTSNRSPATVEKSPGKHDIKVNQPPAMQLNLPLDLPQKSSIQVTTLRLEGQQDVSTTSRNITKLKDRITEEKTERVSLGQNESALKHTSQERKTVVSNNKVSRNKKNMVITSRDGSTSPNKSKLEQQN